MAVVSEVNRTGRIPILEPKDLSRLAPFVRTKEDVPHEGALPDLYGEEVERALEEAIESGRLRWLVNLKTGETVLGVRTEHSNV
ncbi:hypothetical protein AB0A69_08015 [Streptomyces sp. NPDC045431]|uniref:hypothetical protein n=1 Tax=Streptomyces sp. NPDC045431 TaxID=3155613 RepID=UPI0033FF1385